MKTAGIQPAATFLYRNTIKARKGIEAWGWFTNHPLQVAWKYGQISTEMAGASPAATDDGGGITDPPFYFRIIEKIRIVEM